MKYLLLTLLISLSASAYGQKFLEGFKVLNLPRGYIPIGAEWNNGVGPNGDGVSEDNITAVKSINSLDIDKTTKLNLDLSILSFLNLGIDYLKYSTINYKNLKIYTVKDFSKTNIRSGQVIIYEAIKADSISLKLTKVLEGDIKLKFDEKLKELQITDTSKFKNAVTLNGDNLFLAYRIFELSKTKVTKKQKDIDNTNGGTIKELNLMDYAFKFYPSKYENCIKSNLDKNGWVNNDFKELCNKNYPISLEIQNFKNTGIDGMPLSERKPIYNMAKQNIVFTNRANSKIVTDFIEVYFMRTPTNPVIFFFMERGSKISITRTETSLKMLKNPSAPGW